MVFRNVKGAVEGLQASLYYSRELVLVVAESFNVHAEVDRALEHHEEWWNITEEGCRQAPKAWELRGGFIGEAKRLGQGGASQMHRE
ncbi:hypothetical protein SKAU_G00229030 [Synaphobranchus kaupii]|uniref:Uncharacterized protein n=1 Tax=Synaphobranchus kaupii TaxID=118154 RepID=A0A9Q1F582_SYNKA|nr:hypothetical protein SKAU_G00229030 [Synaphobranchus kaupii]